MRSGMANRVTKTPSSLNLMPSDEIWTGYKNVLHKIYLNIISQLHEISDYYVNLIFAYYSEYYLLIINDKKQANCISCRIIKRYRHTI